MNPEWLQSLCVLIAIAGFLCLGIGGAGAIYFGKKTLRERESASLARENELMAQVVNLRHEDEALRLRLAEMEKEARQIATPKKGEAQMENPVQQTTPPEPARHPNETKTEKPNEEAAQTFARKTPDAIHQELHPSAIALLSQAVPEAARAPSPTAEKLEPPPEKTEHAKNNPASEPPVKKARLLEGRQRAVFIEALRKYEGRSITIYSPMGDAEAHRFAQSLGRAFYEAGWRVKGVTQVTFDPPRAGLCLSAGSFPSPEELVASYRALTSAGFEVTQQLDPNQPALDRAVLIVGAAPEK